MPPRRCVSSPDLDCLQRTSLDSGYYPVVDAVLKQLKACSRRLQAALSSYRTELQVLERLYYKGKNQHRAALFWQRVTELRKLGERVGEMHMDKVIEDLRLSFWGGPSARTKKVLKGPWTRYPDAKSLLFVLERCSACCTLIDRTQECSLRAYESFTLMMQTGAFLQLTLALVAIASRANILLSEVKAVLEISWSAGYTALHILYPSDAQKVKQLLQSYQINIASSRTMPSAVTTRLVSKILTPNETLAEDLGHTLDRIAPTPTPEETLTPAPSAPSAVSTLQPTTDKEDHLDITTFSLSSEIAFGQVTSVPAAAASASAAKRKKGNSEGGPTKAAKKKKKKRDEIDDIFGI